jgi:hypothetical protein
MDNVTVWLLPADTVNGDAGVGTAPVGNPESATITGPLKLFWPVTDTVKLALELPGLAANIDGEDVILKSCRFLTVSARLAE